MYPVSRHFAYAAVIGLGIIPATVARAEDEDRNDFVQTNLVSDIPGLATITDPELVNPWGVSLSPISPFWVSNQATSTSTLYSVTDETKVSKVNVRDIGGDVYVIYAPAGRANQINAPLGAGAVAIFDEDGNFIKELVAGSRLAAPWGITLAPPSFGRFGSHLLVGNFSFRQSEINAFNPIDGEFNGTLPIRTGGMRPGGLWTIEFGIGGNNGSPDTLY